jgi:hypothetical protein
MRKRWAPKHGRAPAPLQDGALITQLNMNLTSVRNSYLVQCVQLAAGRFTRGRVCIATPLTVTQADNSFTREVAIFYFIAVTTSR